MVVSILILTTCVFALHQFAGHKALRNAAKVLLGVTVAQLALGLGAYIAGARADTPQLSTIVLTVMHVATGALTLAASVVLSIQIRRNVRVPAPSVSASRQTAVIS
jgi:heme A synthase